MANIAYVRDFNGSSDYIRVAVDTLDSAYTAMSMVCIVKPDTITVDNHTILARPFGSVGAEWQMGVRTTNNFGVYDSVSGVTRRPADGYVTTAMGWVLLAATKTSGTTPWRWHRYRYDTLAWDHQDDDVNTLDFGSATSGGIFIGALNSGPAELYDGKIACIGIWTGTALSDANLVGMVGSTASWQALSPTSMWLLNQTSAAVPVTDLIGNADEIAISGTTATAESTLTFDVAAPAALPLSNTFETGVADETPFVLVSSGGSAGNVFDYIHPAGTAVYDTARFAHGSLSLRYTQDTGVAAIMLGWNPSVGTQTTLYGRHYIYRTGHPTPGNHHMFQAGTWGGATQALVGWVTSGGATNDKLGVADSTLSYATFSTNTVPLNEWVRVEFKIVCSATVGIVEAKMFHADSSSAIETITLSNCNTGVSVNYALWGQVLASDIGAAAPFWLDDFALNNSGYPGSSVPAGAPLTTTLSPWRW